MDEPIGICKVRVNFTARLLAHFRIPGYRQLKGNENSDKGIKKLDGEHICVDIFQRTNGTYGFDEFRRDPEDTNGWYSIGHFGNQIFDDADAALTKAKNSVHWLSRQLYSTKQV